MQLPTVLALSVSVISFFSLLCQSHVKSILNHQVTPPGSLTAQYYNDIHKHDAHGVPSCASNYSHTDHKHLVGYCLVDYEYPLEPIQHAIKYHYHAVASIYKDVIIDTDLSVDNLATLEQEKQFLCSASVEYVKPLRAINTHGEWSIIVNNIPANYDDLTQTVRIEKCHNPGKPCPYIPGCYESKCVQKYAYHRFLVYNPKDYYYPFKVESFKLPSSCDCFTGSFHYESHHRKQQKQAGSVSLDSDYSKVTYSNHHPKKHEISSMNTLYYHQAQEHLLTGDHHHSKTTPAPPVYEPVSPTHATKSELDHVDYSDEEYVPIYVDKSLG